MTIDLAVVLCTRNGLSRGFLDQALNSVLAQTTPPAEVIVVDDHSEDGTPEYVRTRFPGVRVVPNPGRGLAAARNTGIRAARSAWIAFIDDDDQWLPDKLRQQFLQIQDSPHPETTIFVARAHRVHLCNNPFAGWPACLLRSPVLPSGALISRALWQRIGLFDESIPHGGAYHYWIRCLQAGAEVRYSHQVLLRLGKHPQQMTAGSRLLPNTLSIDAIRQVFLESLPFHQARHLRGALRLTGCRALAFHNNFRAIADYWSASPLRPAHFSWRACVFFMLDTLACRAPVRMRLWLCRQGVSILLTGRCASGID
ncbi:MAG TPA: glycosyltransferase family A protein [Candidatus Aminicenantes bacterium]|nr:glycosyltransferase family A protein [Candidatus Aminicenantes bacterium]